MHFEGRTEIATARRRAWEFLIDPRNVAACVPGAPAIEKLDDTHYRLKVSIGGGLFRTSATVALVVTEAVEPERAKIDGSGGAMGGSVTATTTIGLTELAPDRTAVTWAADVTLGGSVAGFAGMVEAPIRGQVEKTLVCVRERLESGG